MPAFALPITSDGKNKGFTPTNSGNTTAKRREIHDFSPALGKTASKTILLAPKLFGRIPP